MDLQNLINTFIPYGLQSLIIGTAVGMAFSVLDFFLKKKNVEIDALFPLVSGFVLFLVYALISMPISEVLSEEATSAFFLCGSVSTAVFVFIKNLKNKNADDKNALKTLLSCYTDGKKAKKVSKKIAEILGENLTGKEFTEKIFSLLQEEGINSVAAKNLSEKIAEEKENGKDKP